MFRFQVNKGLKLTKDTCLGRTSESFVWNYATRFGTYTEMYKCFRKSRSHLKILGARRGTWSSVLGIHKHWRPLYKIGRHRDPALRDCIVLYCIVLYCIVPPPSSLSKQQKSYLPLQVVPQYRTVYEECTINRSEVRKRLILYFNWKPVYTDKPLEVQWLL